jgi:hypothetical protein
MCLFFFSKNFFRKVALVEYFPTLSQSLVFPNGKGRKFKETKDILEKRLKKIAKRFIFSLILENFF